MGIRFYCRHCQQPLNVKADQAGSYCRCAYCNGSIKVPLKSVVRSGRSGRTNKRPQSSSVVLSPPKSPSDSQVPAVRRQEFIDLIDSAPTKIWYVRHPQHGESGPFNAREFKALVEEKRIAADSQILREDWVDWSIAGTVFPNLMPPEKSSGQPSAFYDTNVEIPAAFSSKQIEKARQKRRVFVGVVAIFAGIATIIGLTALLVYLLRQP